ncbi:ester cyclase [Fulvivirga sediminis]|uniref:Ester cyclase n=1 Tax=Fulvivirga sediminis TaxID=2803949 RepID=A0A937FBX9_9BACT|nr:ester cyclase [Fulvivirga sediminis]MBL3658852.1 ester cyclase [Fulvivirga sediminis]
MTYNRLEANKELVIRFNREFLEQGDFSMLDQVIDPDFINRTPFHGSCNAESLVMFNRWLHESFNNIRIEMKEIVSEDDLVASRKLVKGTHSGNIPGHQAGEEACFQVMDFIRIHKGKCLEYWSVDDFKYELQYS